LGKGPENGTAAIFLTVMGAVIDAARATLRKIGAPDLISAESVCVLPDP